MRIEAWIAALAAAGSLLATACFVSVESPEAVGKEIIIFVDFSQSMGPENRALIEQDFEKLIIPSLEAGDQLLVAPINEQTLTSFYPLLAETFPKKPEFNGWFDNTLQYNKALKAVEEEVDVVQERIRAQVPKILQKSGGAQKTDIFGSLLMAEKLFDRVERRKVLILMSDMIVDYPPYRFDRMSWSAEKTEKLLSELETSGLVADLSDVCIYVSGATAASAQLVSQIGAFWQAYFERAHADLHPSRYAHVLLHWPPSGACDS